MDASRKERGGRLRASSLVVCLVLALAPVSGTRADRVTARGVGPTRQLALDTAFRDAIGQVMGVRLQARTHVEEAFSEGTGQDRDTSLYEDEVVTRDSGAVRDFRVLTEGADPLGYRIEIEADVFDPGVDEDWLLDRIVALQGRRLGVVVEADLPREARHLEEELVELVEDEIAQSLVDTGMTVFTSGSGRMPRDLDVHLALDMELKKGRGRRAYGMRVESWRGTVRARAVDGAGRLLFQKRYRQSRRSRSSQPLALELGTALAEEVGEELPRAFVEKLVAGTNQGYQLRVVLEGRNLPTRLGMELGHFLANAAGVAHVAHREIGSQEVVYDVISLVRPDAFVNALYQDLNRIGLQLDGLSGTRVMLKVAPGGYHPAPPARPGTPPAHTQAVPGGGTPAPTYPAGTPILPTEAYRTPGASPAATPAAPARPAAPAAPPIAASPGGTSLKLESQPTGARVILDDQFVGRSPVALAQVPPGSHTVRFLLEGHEQHEESFQLPAGQGKRVVARMQKAVPRSKQGFLSIGSDPGGATVQMAGGDQLGVTSMYKARLAAGVYEVRVKKPGYRDEVLFVEIQPGKETAKRVQLQKLR